MACINRINIAILGGAGVGKSVALNALTAHQFTQCLKTRSTLHPHIYTESRIKSDVFSRNIYSDKTEPPIEYKDICRIEYTIPRIVGVGPLCENVILSIHDLPSIGISDSRNGIYHRYVSDNFHEYDIVLFMADINYGITAKELEILDLITTGIKANRKAHIETKLFILFNKCDNLVNSNSGRIPRNLELRDIFNESVKNINKKLNDTLNKGGRLFKYRLHNISFEDAFIYRMIQANKGHMLNGTHIDRVGNIEFGTRSWNMLTYNQKITNIYGLAQNKLDMGLAESNFTNFIADLNNCLDSENQYKYAMNRIYHDIKTAITASPERLDLDVFTNVRLIQHEIDQLHNKFDEGIPAHLANAGLEEYTIKASALKVLSEKITLFMEHHTAYIEKAIININDAGKLLNYRGQLERSRSIIDRFAPPLLSLVDNNLTRIYTAVLKNKKSSIEQLTDAIYGLKASIIDAEFFKTDIIGMINCIEDYEFCSHYINNYTSELRDPTFITRLYLFIRASGVDIKWQTDALARLALYDLRYKLNYIKLHGIKNAKAVTISHEILSDILLINSREFVTQDSKSLDKSNLCEFVTQDSKSLDKSNSSVDKSNLDGTYRFVFRQFTQVVLSDDIVIESFKNTIQSRQTTFLSILLSFP